MLHVARIFAPRTKTGTFIGEMLLYIPYMEHMGIKHDDHIIAILHNIGKSNYIIHKILRGTS